MVGESKDKLCEYIEKPSRLFLQIEKGNNLKIAETIETELDEIKILLAFKGHSAIRLPEEYAVSRCAPPSC